MIATFLVAPRRFSRYIFPSAELTEAVNAPSEPVVPVSAPDVSVRAASVANCPARVDPEFRNQNHPFGPLVTSEAIQTLAISGMSNDTALSSAIWTMYEQ